MIWALAFHILAHAISPAGKWRPHFTPVPMFDIAIDRQVEAWDVQLLLQLQKPFKHVANVGNSIDDDKTR